MISDRKKLHYLAVKSLSALLRKITLKHDRDFYCLNCFQSCTTKNKLKKHEDVCKDHDYCYVQIPKEENNILKYNHREKSVKVPFVIYADLESLLKNRLKIIIDPCYNDPKKSSLTKVNEHIPSGYSLFTKCSFNTTKNKLDYYRGKDCMEKFCKDLKEHATKIIKL